MSDNVNIKDIAKYCGVGVSTVSRVLNGRLDVSAQTREKVLQAIAQLNYVPNNSARTLAMNSSNSIGVIVHGLTNPFFLGIINVIEEDIYKNGYTMVLHQISQNADELKMAAMLIAEKKLRGIIFLGGRFDYTPQEVAAISVPYVCVSYTNNFGRLEENSYSSVAIDDEYEARRAVRHLHSLGHKRIALLLPREGDRSISKLRHDGYNKALEELGLDNNPKLIEVTGDFELDSAYRATERLLDKKADFTAIFAMTDILSLGAMKALSNRGLRVPEDFSVMGIDGLEVTGYVTPTLTTLVQPSEKMARESTRILIDLIEGRGKNRHLLLPATLRTGGSAGKNKI